MTLGLECLASEAVQSAVDAALPVAPLTCGLLVEASTAPATLQLLLNGARLPQQARACSCLRLTAAVLFVLELRS